MRRIALVATPTAESDPSGVHGALDGDAVLERLAQADAGFEVHLLDPRRDLAEQLDEVFDALGDEAASVDAVFYASAPVVLAPDDELFLCLDPGETETGDALGELAGVFTDRAGGRRLFVLDCRFPPSDDPLRGVSCMESIQRGLRGRAEVLAAARPGDEARAGAISPLTRALLQALDAAEPGQPLTAKAIHETIVDEAQVAGEVRALAYLSRGTSMPLIRGDVQDAVAVQAAAPEGAARDDAAREDAEQSAAGEDTGESAAGEDAEESAAGDTAEESAAGEDTEESAPASIPVPLSVTTGRGTTPPGDGRPRTLSLRIGPEAAARAERHVAAARDLAHAGFVPAALDELRRASLVAPPGVRAAIAREQIHVAARGGDPNAEDRWLDALADDEPAMARALLDLARKAEARGDHARSTALLERAAASASAPDEVLVALRAGASRAGDARGVARWTRAVAGRITSPRARARLLREAAAAHESVGQRDEAAAALEAAVEADPTQLGALDALSRLLGTAERWSYLAAMCRRLAGRCDAIEPESLARATRGAILGRLGGLLRDRSSDPAGALAAFADALAEGPRDPSLHLAALLVALDAGDAGAALDHVEPAARAGHLDLELTLRLRDLLLAEGRGAAAERAAIVAEALGATDDATLAAAAAARVPGTPATALGPSGFAAWLGDEVDPELDAFLRVVTPAAAAARLEQLASEGRLPDLEGAPTAPEGSAVARAVSLAARVLGADRPRVIVVREGRVPFRAWPSSAGSAAGEPVIVASEDATDGLPPRELAFLAGRAVARLWGHHVLCELYPDAADLEALVLGAASSAVPEATIDSTWAEAASERRAELEPWVGEDEHVALAAVTRDLAAADAPLDGAAWHQAIARRIDRAGLLVAGDVHAAVSVVAREAGDGARLDDLLGFYLSTSYEAVLDEVGGSMWPPPPGPDEPGADEPSVDEPSVEPSALEPAGAQASSIDG